MEGMAQSPLELIKPQIERAVDLVQQEPDETAWPELLASVWIEAIGVLIRYAYLSEGRRDAAEIHARRFARMSPSEQQVAASRHGIALEQFVRIVRTASGFRRSSERPPPLHSSPVPPIPRHSDVTNLGIVIDPRLRKVNPR